MEENKLGKLIRGRRKAMGLTLKQVSDLSGVHHSGISRIERGERMPRGFTLRKLAKPLGFREIRLFKIAGFIS